MRLSDLEFPVFVLPKDTEIDTQDGIVFADRQMLDDLNAKGSTIGIRRLRSSYPTKFNLNKLFFLNISNTMIGILAGTNLTSGDNNLNKAVHDIPSFLKVGAKKFVDSKGTVFNYEKTRMVDLKYLHINKVQWNESHSVLWVEDVNFPFNILRPPSPEMRWAGLLYDKGLPWILYEYSEFRKKDTKRKI